MDLAPIVLFVYNRPWHTEQALNALVKNDLASQSTLYIYADGPKPNASKDDLAKIDQTRALIRKKNWCAEVHIIESERNNGLADAIVSGVTEVINKHGSAIVLEDDIVATPYFLRFMNDALQTYEQETDVLSIGAFNFFATDNDTPDTFFVPIPDCWGWATWKNRWDLFEPNGQHLLNQLRKNDVIDKFNLGGAYNFEQMLVQQIKGEINSWAIRWQAVAYLNNKLTLYPKYSVTKNIGFDTKGTHGGNDAFTRHLKIARKPIETQKIAVRQIAQIEQKMIAGYRRWSKPLPRNIFKESLKKSVKNITPFILHNAYKKWRPGVKPALIWSGNYNNWAEAKAGTTGYDNPEIWKKTLSATLKVKNGQAAYERDSIVFDKIHYNWPLITCLSQTAIESNNRVSVLDFGGSFGSSYFQNKDLIPPAVTVEWNIVEQGQYLEPGNKMVADDYLHFYADVSSCLKIKQPNMLLLSSVLQYLEKPGDLIASFLQYPFNYIFIDRTAFINRDNRITVQNTPSSIYQASYPAWFFNEKQFKQQFLEKYDIIAEFDDAIISPLQLEDGAMVYWKGFMLKKRNG